MIWNIAAEQFPDAIEIVDIYHAKQHLCDVAKAIYGPGGYSGGSGTRNPEEVEHRFRRKWNSESGKWNTESGGSGTSIPEEVEQRFRRS